MATGTFEMHKRHESQTCGAKGCAKKGKEILTRNPTGLTIIVRCIDHLAVQEPVGFKPVSIRDLLAMPTRNGG